MVDFFELDLAGRFAVARTRLDPLAEALGGIVTLEDTSGPSTLAQVDRDGMFVIVRARAPGTGRAVRLVGSLVDLDHSSGLFRMTVASAVEIAVEVDNRLGELSLVRAAVDAGLDEAPDAATHDLVSGSIYVSDLDPAARVRMKARLERLPGIVELADRYLRLHNGSSLYVLHSVATTLGFLDDDDDEWAAGTRDLVGQIEALDRIAAMIETMPIAGFAICRFCSGRFMPGPTVKCPHCGAAL